MTVVAPQASGSRRLVAVTFALEHRDIDVVLPDDLPLSQLLPRILDLAQDGSIDDQAAQGRPASWSVAPIGAAPLPWDATLADAGINDGDTLLLTTRSHTLRGATVHDVASSSAGEVDLLGDKFDTPAAQRWWTLMLAVPAILALVGVLLTHTASAWPLLLVGIACLAGVADLRVRRAADASDWRPALLILAGTACIATAGWLWSPDSSSAPLAITGLVAGPIGLASSLTRTSRMAGALLATLACALLLAALGHACGISTTVICIVVALLAYMAVGAAPQFAISAGGLWGLDLLAKTHDVDRDQVNASVQASTDVLTGIVAGLGLIAGCAATTVAAPSGSAVAWRLAFALLVLGALLVRARVFSRRIHVTSLRLLVVAAFVPIIALSPATSIDPAWAPVVLSAAVLVLLAWIRAPWLPHHRARGRLALGWLEIAASIALVPVAFGAANFYGWLADRL